MLNACDDTNSQLFDLIQDIKSQNDELLREVKALKNQSDLLINELKSSAARQEELLLKVTDLQTQLTNVLSQISTLNDKLKNQDADLQSIKLQLSELQNKYEGIMSQLEELKKLSQLLSEIEKLKLQLNQLDEKYMAISENLSQNKQDLNILKDKITLVQNQLDLNFEGISELLSKLGDQGTDITTILSQINDLKIEVGDLKSKLGGLLRLFLPKVGDEFGGGIVFYLDTTSLKGLIVTKINLSNSGTEWGCYNQNIENTSPEIGTGQKNTKEMLTQCVSAQSISNWSAKIADQYVFDKYDDWYLPSKNELYLIYQNLHLKGIGGFSSTIPYWSSTQASLTSGWALNFGTGTHVQEYKAGYSGTGAVRAVRSF